MFLYIYIILNFLGKDKFYFLLKKFCGYAKIQPVFGNKKALVLELRLFY